MKTNFKIFTLTALLGAFLFASCDNGEAEKAAQAAAATAAAADLQKDSTITAYVRTLNEIDSNLDVIRDKSGLIVLGPNSNMDEGVSKKEQILRNIAMINDLLHQNQEKMDKLEKQLTQSKSKNVALNLLTKDYREKMEKTEAEMAQLKEQLAALSYSKSELEAGMAKLKEENGQLAEAKGQLETKTEQMDKQIHTAWYTVGTYKELKNSKVLEKNGGVLGLGRTQGLGANFDKGAFTQVDTKSTTVITLNSEKAKVITNHPVQSYTIEKAADGTLALHITDPDLFWSVSKYLVIETKA